MRIFFLALFAFFLAAPADAMNIQKVVSESGIEAWLVEEHAIPSIALQAGFHGGSAIEPKGLEGEGGMLAALLDQGAGNLDARAFQDRLADKAIVLNFEIDRDAFYASFGTLSENRDEAFAMLGLALTKARFDDAPVKRMRGQFLARLTREREDPDSIAAKRWFQAAFGDHPYGRWPHGSKASIDAIKVSDLKAFASHVLARDRLFIAVVGDIDAKTLAPLLDKTFGALPAKSPPENVAMIEPAGGKTPLVDHIPNPQSLVMFGNKGLLRADPDFYAASVLNYIVGGGGFASRLTHEIREKRGLVYNVSTGLSPLDHAGLMLGDLATENAHVGEAIGLVKKELKRIVSDGATAEELADAKTYLTGSFPLRFSSNSKIASELVGIQLEHLGIDYVDRRNGLIEAVMLDDLKRVAPRIYDPEHLLIAVVGDPKGL
jgi:zinc protease